MDVMSSDSEVALKVTTQQPLSFSSSDDVTEHSEYDEEYSDCYSEYEAVADYKAAEAGDQNEEDDETNASVAVHDDEDNVSLPAHRSDYRSHLQSSAFF